MKHITTACSLLLALTMLGCRTTGQPAPPGATTAPPASGDIIASPSGEKISFEEMAGRLAPMRAVYVGESHNNDYHHDLQFRVVRAMYAQDPNLIIGMEMFQRPTQAGLDRFLAGEIDEATFLKETEYFSRWKWDYRYYRPILLFAKEHGLAVIAANSPAEANRKVSRGGGLDALTEADREWVAGEIDLTNAAHREAVMGIFAGHPMMPGFDVDAFYASQCVWEDTMAESVARALEAHPGSRIVMLAGGFHVRQRFGVPLRAERRGARPYAIILGMDLDLTRPQEPMEELLAEDLADYLAFTKPAPESAPSPKVGVMLDQQAGGPGLLVTGVTPGSVAGLAGVKQDDRITGLSGAPVATLEDLQIALALHTERIGTIVVNRGGETKVLTFDLCWARP
jgi:uncharacterized iron-regulated protein